MSTPSIKVGQGNWGIKAGNLLAYANTEKKFVAREFTVGRLLDTATRVNASGDIEIVNANIPRIDYFGGQASLLVEPSVSNGILNSADTATNWQVGSSLTSGAIDVIGVSGNNLTVAVSGGSIGSGPGRLGRTANNFSLVSGSTYTISFFIKKTATHTIGGYFAVVTGAASGNLGSAFDVSGTFSSNEIYTSALVSGRVRRVEQGGTDVFRCSETFTMLASGTLTSLFLAPLVLTTSTTNSAVGTQLGFAAPQIELGSVPTSFIPTTTVSGTRNADVISVTGVAGLIGQTEGTIYLEIDLPNPNTPGQRTIIELGSSPTRIYIAKDSNTQNIFQLATQSSAGYNFINTTNQTASVLKFAIAYASGNNAFYLNGTQISTASANANPTGISSILLGNSGGTNTPSRIRAAVIYPTRLPNTSTDGSPSLQSITTL